MASSRIVGACVALALATLLLPGCGPGGLDKHTVTGTVTFDGEPVGEGDIIFTADDGSGVTDAGKIANGKYSLETTPGKKSVRIMAMREVPGQFDESNPGEKVPVKEMYIPDKYSGVTELKADVTAGGDNVFDFPLTSN